MADDDKNKEDDVMATELDKVIKAIIKDMNANRTVDQIAKRNKVEKEFVEDVLQIYTTHPGIDMDGILDRLKFYS